MFREQFDNLLKNHEIEKAKSYCEDMLYKAITQRNTEDIIIILNEMIGFYRDLNEHDVSLKYANSLKAILNNVKLDDEDLSASLVNIANSYRVNRMYEESIELFDKALSLTNNDLIKASIYNNKGLTLIASNDFQNAIESLNEALKFDTDKIKLATTLTNIASCYYQENRIDKALEYLDKAGAIFNDNIDDFHYMGYMTLKARVTSLIDEASSIKFYELALQSIMANVGKTQLYNEVKEELFCLYDKHNLPRHINGIKLSKEYYNKVKEQLFDGISDDTKRKMTVGLFGLGSECYNASDEISEDHDFDPGFICLVEDDVTREQYQKLQENYAKLPKKYYRFYIANLDKKGVHYYKKYLSDFFGVEDLGRLTELQKSLITNGEVFYYGSRSSLNKLRKQIAKETKDEYVVKLALKTLEINQYIPYNLNRAKQRNEAYTYMLLKNHLVDKLIEYYYLYHFKYLMHDKLSIRLMDESSIITKWIKEILDGDVSLELCETISSNLLKVLHKYGVIKEFKTIYIEDYKDEIIENIKEYKEKLKLIEEIIAIELPLFKACNNLGEVANCQLNDSYFKLMRKSQFVVFSTKCLESYLNDLRLAKEFDYNIVSFKYGFMMEDYDLNNYNLIKDSLPKLKSKQIALIEEVVKMQLESKIEFDKANDSSQMRANFTSSDTLNNVSYETYLRGELKSYSEKTLYLYALNLVDLIKKNRNIVSDTINFTYLFKGDESYYL